MHDSLYAMMDFFIAATLSTILCCSRLISDRSKSKQNDLQMTLCQTLCDVMNDGRVGTSFRPISVHELKTDVRLWPDCAAYHFISD